MFMQVATLLQCPTQGRGCDGYNGDHCLQEVSVRKKALYHVEFRVLNTEEVGGIPQHRERIYIAGIQRCLLDLPVDKVDNFKFEWPHDVLCPALTKFLSPNNQNRWVPTAEGYLNRLVTMIEKIREDGGVPGKVNYVIDIAASEQFARSYMEERSPTLTRARAGSGGYYLTAWRRLMTTREIAKLQGFPGDIKRGQATERQFRQMCGNAMTTTVVARVLEMLLKAGGYIKDD